MSEREPAGSVTDRTRDAESGLRRLGYARVPPQPRAAADPTFWVQESGVPRRTFPVFVPDEGDRTVVGPIDRWATGLQGAEAAASRAIFVVPTDAAGDAAWARLREVAGLPIDTEVSVLVVPPAGRSERGAHFSLRVADPREILRIATGIAVGLFRRAQASEGSSQVDFEEMLGLLKGRFGLDLSRSLGVQSDEDALFLLYQLAQRDAYAPGDPGSNLHLLVLKPTGPAARLPWFAA